MPRKGRAEARPTFGRHVARLGRAGAVFCLFALLTLAHPLGAHTPETSYCRIDIARDHVTFTLTYDYTTLSRITPIDANHDNRITREEFQAAIPKIEQFLRDNVYVELNELQGIFGDLSPPKWPADAANGIPATEYNQRLAAFTFTNPVLHAPDSVAITFDFFEKVGERHTVLGTFAWNGHENEVIFTRLEPDYLFDTGYQVPALEEFRQYVGLGIEHIFRGYDHIAFLLALLFVRRFRALIKVITAFSVAHTITLALAALDVVALPSRFVESAIAVSIIYVAAENIWRGVDESGRHRWKIAFGFGLIHGFGFASILRELGLPAHGLVRSLLGFNLGVELGQLVIASVCWPILWWISRRPWAPRVRMAVSWILLLFGAAWLVERIFSLKFLPI